MKIKDIIDFLEKDKDWVDWNKTRDHLLFGDSQQEVIKIGVCWVATQQVIETCQQKQINFLITHENPFYFNSTQLSKNLFITIENKKKKLQDAHLSVYRCHDVWDCLPEIGISDEWANQFENCNEKIKLTPMLQLLKIEPICLMDLAKQISQKMLKDGENGVYIIGDIQKIATKIVIGTGAATDVFQMAEVDPDVFIVSEDGINCWSSAQYVLDLNKAMIVVSHCCCEKAGLKNMPEYLKKNFPNIMVEYIDDGVKATFVAIT